MSASATVLMPTTPKPSPRWLYGFFAFIDRLPFPAWLVGFLVILISSIGMHLEAWRRGVLPSGFIDGYLITVGNYPIFLLAAWIFLDNRARLALTAFFKESNKGLAKLEGVLTDFISLPNWLAASALLVGIPFGYFNFQIALSLSPLAGQVFPAYEMLGFILVGGWVGLMFLRALRQALLLRRYYAEVEVNIFNPAPLYALSRYSSQTGVAFVLLTYTVILVSLPMFLMTTNGYITSIMLIGSMFTLFFVSLGGINGRMRDEKARLLSELGQDLEDVYARVHKAVRREDYSRLDKMRNTISTLKDGWEIVKKVPTWPWEPETLRNLLIPLLFPVIVYLIQRYLGALFGG